MDSNIGNYKTSRFAIARKKNDLKKNIIVKLIYFITLQSKSKNNYKLSPNINNCIINVESISGSVKYEVLEIQFKMKMIFFLNLGEVYFIDLNQSIFDLVR
ncbi:MULTISPECIES: hypothetical protein [Acinetobacter]|uniref:hypothetical protein n=1 Tax=Acinetobacter TaxID=469 RepID=UPI00141AC7B7|nr:MULTISPECIES: hypothetical protein [Acinetobacter]MCS4299130.1 hypothetical protein [Acinetobacter guillouiae]MCW2250223.1 heme/copper-type cytochrome/quinol oxidase subunit 4 [Acinetobacter sp. BIGb0204]NII39326.1 hypothetical protein [Acinetobacter sp. BIGb0196]